MSKKLFGYAGKMLRVDLGKGKVQSEDTRMDWASMFIGGKGLGFRYFYSEVKPQTDPLSPGNKLIIITGPLVGTGAPVASKQTVVFRSPLTGTVCDSYFAGDFGLKMKLLGYDGAIIEGKSDKPVYLRIGKNGVELKNASQYWGMGAIDAMESIVKQRILGFGGKNPCAFFIGPAGENLVKFANVNIDVIYSAGRGGCGAVMGSKKLKGIVVDAEQGKIPVPDPKSYTETVANLVKNSVLTDANMWAKTDGTPLIVDITNAGGILPTKGHTTGTFEGASKINTEIVKKYKKLDKPCSWCPLACKKILDINGKTEKAPEYETIALCGSNCGLDDFVALTNFNTLCNNLGMDTITTGNLIGFVMRIYEKGIISKKQLDGVEAKYGDAKAMTKLAEKIARREGVGAILADGVKAAAKKFGGDAELYTFQVKGQESPAYDPRGSWGQALAYATADRGCCHLRAWPVSMETYFGGQLNPVSFENKAAAVVDLENLNAVKWSIMLCDFWVPKGDYTDMAQLLSGATGKQYTADDLKLAGERIWNLGKLINLREGFTRKDDIPSKGFFELPIIGGPTDGKKLPRADFEKALTEYYTLRGWNEDGTIKQETLKRLSLEKL